MADKGSYTIAVRLTDGVTGPMKQINRELAKAQAPFKAMNAEFQRFSKLTGLDKVTAGFKNLTNHVTNAAKGIIRMVPALGALTGIASLAGMATLIRQWADFGTSLGNSSALIGTTVSNLQSLQNAARLAGVSAEAMTSSLNGIGRAAQDALSGRDGAAASLFQRWGIGIRKAGYQAKDGASLIMQEFDAIRRASQQGMSAANIQRMAEIWHISPDLIPMAEREGSSGLRRQQALAKSYGVYNEAGAKGAYQLRQSFTGLSLAVEGFGMSISEKVGPALSGILDDMAKWINANRQWIATDIGEAVKKFATWLRGSHPHIRAILTDMREWLRDINSVVKALGGWQHVSEAILGMWIGAKVGMALLRITSMLSLIRAVTAASKAATVAPLVESVEAATVGVTGLGAALTALAIPAALTAALAALAWLVKKGSDSETPGNRALIEQNRRNMGSGLNDLQPQDGYNVDGTVNLGHARKTKGLPSDVEQEIRDQATSQGVNPDWMVALARTEGGPGTSPAGAQGYLQLMPGTAAGLGVDPSKRHQNIEGGVRYFHQMLDLFHGNYAAASAAYNAGPNNPGVKHFAQTGDASQLPLESRNYVATIQAQQQPSVSPEVSRVIDRLKSSLAGKPAGQTTAPAATAPAQAGHLQVSINAPAGWPTSARASGNVINGAPRIVSPMAAFAIG